MVTASTVYEGDGNKKYFTVKDFKISLQYLYIFILELYYAMTEDILKHDVCTLDNSVVMCT